MLEFCAGGRHSIYKGKMPGVLEEILIAAELKKPLFLLGGFGGVTSNVCRMIEEENIPEELTESWQISNNLGYIDLIEYTLQINSAFKIDYTPIKENLTWNNLNNGLSQEENIKLFKTPFVNEALYYIFKGLNNLNT